MIALRIIIIVSLIVFEINLLESKIFKKIDPDGTIHYYNKPDQKKTKKIKRTKYDKIIDEISKKNKVDPYLIKCLIKIESNFNPDAVSEAGAMGLMQLMQETAEMYDIKNVFDARENLEAGIKHFKFLLKRLNNDVPLALAAYHAGLGRVIKNKKVPSIPSTVKYVNMVMKLYKGPGDYTEKVVKLFKKIDKDGTINIYSR